MQFRSVRSLWILTYLNIVFNLLCDFTTYDFTRASLLVLFLQYHPPFTVNICAACARFL